MSIRKYDHPGKLEGELLIAAIVADDHDESLDFGGGDSVDYYGLVRGPVDATETPDGERLNQDEIGYLKTFAGAIVHELDQGFITFVWYDKGQEKELAAAWGALEDESESQGAVAEIEESFATAE